MDAPTVGSDRPTTLPPTSFTTMMTEQLFMIQLPSSSPSHDKGKVPDVPEALMDAPTVGSDRPTTLPPRRSPR